MTRVSQGNLPEMNHSSRHFFLFRLSRGCVGSIGSVRRWFRRRPLLRVAKRFIGHAGPIVSRGRGDAKPYVECARKLQRTRSEEHTSELQSRLHLVCRLLLEKKNKKSSAHATLARCAR